MVGKCLICKRCGIKIKDGEDEECEQCWSTLCERCLVKFHVCDKKKTTQNFIVKDVTRKSLHKYYFKNIKEAEDYVNDVVKTNSLGSIRMEDYEIVPIEPYEGPKFKCCICEKTKNEYMTSCKFSFGKYVCRICLDDLKSL